MKYIASIILLTLTVFVSSCGSSKERIKNQDSLLIDNSSVQLIEKVVFQKWVAGLEKVGSGYSIEIYPVKNGRTLNLKSVYFRGLKGEITLGKITYVSALKEKLIKDIQLSSKPSDEYKNTLPEVSQVPFLLNDNECVVSYVDNDTIKFLKVLKVKEKAAIYYPSAKPKN